MVITRNGEQSADSQINKYNIFQFLYICMYVHAKWTNFDVAAGFLYRSFGTSIHAVWSSARVVTLNYNFMFILFVCVQLLALGNCYRFIIKLYCYQEMEHFQFSDEHSRKYEPRTNNNMILIMIVDEFKFKFQL